MSKDFSLGEKWDAMLYAMKEARYYLMLRRDGERSFGETHNEAEYVKRICEQESWPPTHPERVTTNAR